MENVKVSLMLRSFADWATIRVVESAAGLMGIYLAAVPIGLFPLAVGVGVC